MPLKKKTEHEDASEHKGLKPRTASFKRRVAPTAETDVPMESNLHPEKLTYEKFSERRRSLDDEGVSPGRLILYIVIVAVIGIALTVGAQAYIRAQNEAQQKALENKPKDQVVSAPVQSSITTNEAIQKDTAAVPTIADDKTFVTTNKTLGQVQSTKVAAWQALSYERFETVERIGLGFSNDVNQPQATVRYKAGDTTMYVDIPNVTTSKSDLKAGTELFKALTTTTTVKRIQNGSATTDMTTIAIYLSESVRYSLQYSQGKLVLDIRQADLTIANTTTTPPPTTTTPPPTTPTNTDAPAAPHYTNSYSKSTQYISSAYAGNKLQIWNYTYRDYGDRYEFKFRIKDDGTGVNPMVPNAKAYLNGDTSNPKLIVEVTNISKEILNIQKQTCFDGVAYGNVKKICGTFDATKNMVTYEISLYRLADFEMDSVDNTSYDAARPGQVIWLKIKDN